MAKASSSKPVEISLGQLITKRASNALAQRYSKDAKKLAATLLYCNFGSTQFTADEKEEMERTTFAHKLFENQVKKKEIVDYFEKVEQLIGIDKELRRSYMNLADDSGKTILAMIDEADLKERYRGIKAELQC